MKSLRQKQIDEVLDYHKNMNQVVFNRQVRHVQASNDPHAAPNKTDIETESGLREKVDAMKINLQQINQFMYGTIGTESVSGMSLSELLQSKRMTEDYLKEGKDTYGVQPQDYTRMYQEQEKTFTKATDRVKSALASIVSEWNSLVNFYELKNRIKSFTESEQNALVGIVKELVDPIKELIGNILKFKQPGKEGEMYYTSYNVLTTIMKNIQSAPPLVKVQASILNDKTGFIDDFSPMEDLNETTTKHFNEMYELLHKKYQEVSSIVASNQVEKDAKQKLLSKLDAEFRKIKNIQNKSDKQIQELVDKRDLVDDKGRYVNNDATRRSYSNMIRKIYEQNDELRKTLLFTDFLAERGLSMATARSLLPGTSTVPITSTVPTTSTGNVRQSKVNPSKSIQKQRSSTTAQRNGLKTKYDATYKDIYKAVEDKKLSDYGAREAYQNLYNEIDDTVFKHENLPGTKKFINYLRDKQIDCNNQMLILTEIIGDDKDGVEESKEPVEERESKGGEDEEIFREEVIPLFPDDDEIGEGKPRRKKKTKEGGAHYPYGKNKFGDASLLAPYLSKHVKPSKFHNTKDDISSSEESSEGSGSDESEDEIGGRRKKHMNKKIQRMVAEMKHELPKQGKAGLAILEQIMVKPRIKRGGKKNKKPVMEYNDKNDMWFL